MSLNLSNYEGKLLFVPLGGSGEIGLNVNLYYLDGKWLMVDLGAGFADDWLPGVDIIVVDTDFLKQHVDNLLGIVLTHAHEDHLGAISYLWPDLQVPIYATNFTAYFLKEKLKEFGYAENEVPINHIDEGKRFNIGNFDLEFVHLTHSVPEMNAVFIRTKHGNILHTGDWKLDPNPVVGAASDLDKLKKFQEEGILAVIGDSTNVFNEGVSGSEGDLKDNLNNIISNIKTGLIVITTFASNVARFESILSIAKESGRKVAISGRALHRVKTAAANSGYLLDYDDIIITTKEIGDYDRDQVLVIATGCQGEPLATISKLALDKHHDFSIKSTDTIIFSSKIIPGNEKRIYRLFNLLSLKNVNFLTEKSDFVHVSGHPNRDEIKEMYEILKPDYVIPVHGETVHLREHARLAESWGYKNVVPQNGSVIEICDKEIKLVEKIESNYQAVDGYSLISPVGGVMRSRRRIGKSGFVGVVLLYNRNGGLLYEPIIMSPGSLDYQEDGELISELKNIIVDNLKKSKKKGIHKATIYHNVKGVIRNFFKTEIGSKIPEISVNIEII